MSSRPSANSRLDRALAISLVAGLAVLMLVGLVFSIAYGSQQITSDATDLHKADEVLRSATVVRAQLAIAVHAGTVDREFGSNSSEAIDQSIDEAESALVDLDEGMEALSPENGDFGTTIATSVEQFAATADAVIAMTRSDQYAEAQLLASGDLDAEFRTLVDELVVVRDGLGESVASSDALLGHIGNAARFLVAFFLPAAIIFLYRALIRRQARQEGLETRLEAERRVSTAREEFIANASHELRTPLTSITGLALLLEEDPVIRESESATELLDLIISESGDLTRMVEDLLTAARLDVGALSYAFEDVDPAKEVAEVAESMRRAGASIEVECEPATIRADQVRLRQILRNLLSNARKYGGPEIRIDGHVDGHTYTFEVSDNGDGVPKHVTDRLFERFVHQGEEKPVQGSVGLGLSIVNALAQGMGGTVVYVRTDGESRFRVRLPLVVGPGGTDTEQVSETDAKAVSDTSHLVAHPAVDL